MTGRSWERCTCPQLALCRVHGRSVLARLHFVVASITRSLLASDLDGTLIPLERDANTLREVADFATAIRGTDHLILAYVTGRHLALALEGIEELKLPIPDLLVCDVGTSLYHRAGTSFETDAHYRKAMLTAFGGIRGDDVLRAVGSMDGLEPQEPEKQAEFKVSYYTDGRPEAFLEPVRKRLSAAGAKVNLVASFDSVTRRGLLDILPAGVAKDHAVRYLHDHTGVEEEHLVYAGDSGNDVAAMLAGYRVVVVANAEDALKEEVRRQSALQGITERIYFAEHPYARGVLEGCKHFGLLD